MQMTIQEIKNAIKYNELNNIETLQATYTDIKHNNDGIIQALGYDDLSNIVMMHSPLLICVKQYLIL